MGTKDFLLELGDREAGSSPDPDELYRGKVSERKRKEIERAEEKDEAKHKAEMAKLKKEETVAETATEKSGEKKEEPEPAFKVKGSIDMGTYNPQELLQKQVDERDELRKQAEEAASRQQAISDDLREKLHASELQVLKTSHDAQMQMLQKLIEASASRGSFADQYKQSMEVAQLMGLVQPQAGADATTSIELKRLEFDNQMTLRKLSREDKAEERKWQIELRKLDDDRDHRREELAQQSKRNEMFASLPQQIGAALAAGAVASGGEGEAVPASPKGKRMQAEIPEGRGAVMDCTECGAEIGIGSTARNAVCANCHAKVSIKRVPAEGQIEPEEE